LGYTEKIEERFQKVLNRIEDCGNEKVEVCNAYGDFREVVKYCDNRCCSESGCQDHRRFKYKRNHGEQIKTLDKSMKSPKAWIFTGWVLPYPLDRSFAQEKLNFLYKLLKDEKHGSITEFSIHMEVKLKENGGYLHFHVVSGGVKDLRFVRQVWGRVVRFEYAIKDKALSDYVSKYASKTPFFESEDLRLYYLMFVYKLFMSRFSSGKSDYLKSGWYLVSQLEYEIYSCLKKNYNDTNEYHPYIEQYDNRKRKPIPNLDKVYEKTKLWFPVETFDTFMVKVKEYNKSN
jgi:hypothetical protein